MSNPFVLFCNKICLIESNIVGLFVTSVLKYLIIFLLISYLLVCTINSPYHYGIIMKPVTA